MSMSCCQGCQWYDTMQPDVILCQKSCFISKTIGSHALWKLVGILWWWCLYLKHSMPSSAPISFVVESCQYVFLLALSSSRASSTVVVSVLHTCTWGLFGTCVCFSCLSLLFWVSDYPISCQWRTCSSTLGVGWFSWFPAKLCLPKPCWGLSQTFLLPHWATIYFAIITW